ncbi:hypothetical protein ACFY05_41995 [Microtetraspora fusca]|uniref:Tail assembly chaperone n=1 Tax=Microtetraspora fusca TaxID=1997 RepID=A0ABW6VMD1_MICFU
MAKPDKPAGIDFNLDAAIAEAASKPFTFAYKGKSWTLRPMGELDIWPLIDQIENGDLALMRATLTEAFGDQWEEFREHPMPGAGLNALFKAYQEHSDANMGESQASSS